MADIKVSTEQIIASLRFANEERGKVIEMYSMEAAQSVVIGWELIERLNAYCVSNNIGHNEAARMILGDFLRKKGKKNGAEAMDA